MSAAVARRLAKSPTKLASKKTLPFRRDRQPVKKDSAIIAPQSMMEGKPPINEIQSLINNPLKPKPARKRKGRQELLRKRAEKAALGQPAGDVFAGQLGQ